MAYLVFVILHFFTSAMWFFVLESLEFLTEVNQWKIFSMFLSSPYLDTDLDFYLMGFLLMGKSYTGHSSEEDVLTIFFL